jgi:outer membrane protein assembly factor BamB
MSLERHLKVLRKRIPTLARGARWIPALELTWILSPSLLVSFGGSCSADWPQFRGTTGTGTSADSPIALEWSSEKHVAWKRSIPGSGWAQPVIFGSQVFVTSAVSDKPARPKDYASGTSDPYTTDGTHAPTPDATIHWKLFALDLTTGAIQWERTAFSGRPRYPIHPSNTYASESPAADQRGLYAFFGEAGLVVSFDHHGRSMWRRELGVYRIQNNSGTGSSLRLHQGFLYVQNFNEEQPFLVCIDSKDGQERWRIAREVKGTSWSTPLLWENRQRTELVVGGPGLLTSHDPLTGQEFWRAAGRVMPVIASASGDAERLYFGNRDPIRGGSLLAFNAGVDGDQSLDAVGKMFRAEAWQAADAAPGISSPVVAGGCVYVVRNALLTCLDAASGKQYYRERLPGCREVVASPIAVGDKLFIVDESGCGLVIQAGTSFRILGRSTLKDRFWASPATSAGALLLRGLDQLYCIRATRASSPYSKTASWPPSSSIAPSVPPSSRSAH